MASDVQNNGVRQHIPLLVILMLGLFLAILNQTLLNVAMPHLMNEFGVAATTIQWLSTGFLLVNGMLIPLSAFLIERFGAKALFIVAMTCFTIGTFICGAAPNFSTMLIGRLIQGVGGGVLQPLVMTMILYIFPPEIRGKGMGIFGLAMMFAPAAGPTLSGWIIQNYNWRLMFYGMVPFGVIVIIISIFTLKNLIEPKKIKLDVFGTIASFIGVGFLLYGVSEAGKNGWTDAVVLSTIIIGVAGIIIFILQQLRSSRPMLDFRVFKYDMFSLANVISSIVTFALYTGMFLLPIYLQNLRGFTPLESGLLMLPGALVMLVMSPISGILFDKLGPRPLAIVGLLITFITTYEFTTLTVNSSYEYILVLYMVRTFGMSLLMMPVMTAGMNQLPRHLNGHGTAMSNTLRQVVGSLGTSLVTTIYTNRTSFHYANTANQADSSDPNFMQQFQQLVQNISQSMHMPLEQAKTQAMALISGQVQLQSNVMGIDDAFFWASGLVIIGFILSLFLRDVRKDKNHAIKKEARKEVRMLPAPKSAVEKA